MEGGFVCEWQVASCREGSPSAKHRTHRRVDTLQDLLKKLMGLSFNKLLRFLIGDIWQESPLPFPRMTKVTTSSGCRAIP